MTDRFKLTFNKPAVRQFLEGDDKGLRIRVDNGVVMFKTSKAADLADAAPLDQRTRGGFEATVEGESAASILENLNNPAGPFFVLKRREGGWVAAEPYKGDDAPPKFEPHVRVWTAREKTADKPVKKKAKSGRRVKSMASAPISGPDTPYLDSVRSAYAKLSEAARPGRPSNEEKQGRMEARDIVASFEATAKELMGLPVDSPRLDLSGLISAHKMIGEFIDLMAPATEETPVVAATPETDDAAAHTANASSKAKASAAASDDQQAEELSRSAMAKLGLKDHDEPKPTRRRQHARPETASA